MNREHDIDGGHVLIEGDRDLTGRLTVYYVKGTEYACVRYEKGWRARKGRKCQGPYYESAPAVTRYLARRGYISTASGTPAPPRPEDRPDRSPTS